MIYSCHQFLELSVENRIKTIKRLKLCINCFRNDHFVARCTAGSCRECGERHNTLCHQPREAACLIENERSKPATNQTNYAELRKTTGALGNSKNVSSGPAVHHMREDSPRNRVLMSTAIVNVTGRASIEHQFRVLLDSASEVNFITITACKKLGLKLDNICQSISSLGNLTCPIEHGCRLHLKS